MNKIEFVLELTERLSFLPREEAEERVHFYVELIDDRMEEGLSEEEAVAAVGSVDKIVAQIAADAPLSALTKGSIKRKRRLKPLEIILLILGSPIWLSLGIAAFAVVISLYISIWAIIVSLWAVFGSLIACTLGSIVAGIFFIVGGEIMSGIAMFGTGAICAGLGILLFFGCKALTNYTLLLTTKCIFGTVNHFRKKGAA